MLSFLSCVSRPGPPSFGKKLRKHNMSSAKYDIASLLNCPLYQEPSDQQLPGLAIVPQQRNSQLSSPAPEEKADFESPINGITVKTLKPESQKAVKRRASECEDEDDAPNTAISAKRCREKWRKPTYLARKEEKCELLVKMKELERQISFLQNRKNIVAWQEKDQHQIETEIDNKVLCNLVKQQYLCVLSAQSALSELTQSVNNRCPIEAYIHLLGDWTKRTETLTSLQAQQCRDAKVMVEKRTQFMAEAREYNENAQFVDEMGDFCSVRFDVTPLEGFRSVEDAVEFIQFHIKHLDTKPRNSKYTCTSEHGVDKSILQRRLIILEVEEVATETNFVLFSEQKPVASQKPMDQGVLVINYVDKDELYPYRPQNCVRLDISGVMSLKLDRKRVTNSTGEEKEETVVILTRWILHKLRRTELPVPTHVLQTMRDRINEPANAFMCALKEIQTNACRA